MIVIVGGGITGLSLAHRLTAQGTKCIVLEATDEPGGVIKSRRVQGHLLDWGPQRARLGGDLLALVSDLNLNDEVVKAPRGLPLWVFRNKRLHQVPFSVREFLTSSIVSPLGKLRVGLEPFTGGARDDESVADFFVRKMGREIYDNLFGPLYGGLYASDPKDMVVGLSLGRVLKEFKVGRSLAFSFMKRGGAISPPPACSFKDGMQTLPRALAQSLGDILRLTTPVRSIKSDGSGWSVSTDSETVDASAVILTTPADVTADLLASVAPEAAGQIRGLRYNPLGVVHLMAHTDLVGLGFQVSLAEPLSLRGVTFNDSLFGRKGVYTAYLGGAKNPDVVESSDAGLGDLAVREFRHCTGFNSQPLSVTRGRVPAWDRTWASIEGLTLPAGLHIASNWESRPGLPGRLAQARRLAMDLEGA